jgi:hypothetical protein
MQNYGTEVRRKENPDYWVMQWKLKIAEDKIANVLVDDVRFQNEYDAVKAWGGVTIRLNRNDIVSTDGHQSEIEQASLVADYTIDCEKDNLEKLYRELDRIVDELR